MWSGFIEYRYDHTFHERRAKMNISWMEKAIPIKYLNTTTHHKVCLAEISHDLILGTPWIARNKVQFD
jgi:hypothetical protein